MNRIADKEDVEHYQGTGLQVGDVILDFDVIDHLRSLGCDELADMLKAKNRITAQLMERNAEDFFHPTP